MLRNKQEEKLKTFRRMSDRMDELDPRGMEWFPVEKPFFIGWDISIGLSESGKRRRDAPNLQQVLDITGASKPYFTKQVRIIRWFRKLRYKVLDVEAGVYSYKNSPYTYGLKKIYDCYIEKSTYENIPDYLKKYFYKSQRSIYNWFWLREDFVYRICYPFPTYELVYKVEKAYAYYLGIPKGEDRSEYDFLNDKLHNAHYWSRKNGFSGYRERWSDDRRRYRKHWKDFCQKIKQTDFSYEEEENLQKYFNNKRIHE